MEITNLMTDSSMATLDCDFIWWDRRWEISWLFLIRILISLIQVMTSLPLKDAISSYCYLENENVRMSEPGILFRGISTCLARSRFWVQFLVQKEKENVNLKIFGKDKYCKHSIHRVWNTVLGTDQPVFKELRRWLQSTKVTEQCSLWKCFASLSREAAHF